MLKLRPEKTIWELKNEINKTHSRWLFLMIILSYFIYVLSLGNNGDYNAYGRYFNWTYTIILGTTYLFANLVFLFYLLKVKSQKVKMFPVVKYLTMTLDLAVTSLVVLMTGAEKSIFFLLYIIVLISNSLRYGLKITILCLIILNIFYVLVLIFTHYPSFFISGIDKEILKICGLWIVGLYIGYLSRRFEVMQGEVEKYQKLVRELMENRSER